MSRRLGSLAALIAIGLLLLAAIVLGSCAPRPRPQDQAGRRSAVVQLWQWAEPIVRQVIEQGVGALLDALLGAREAAGTPEADGPVLERVTRADAAGQTTLEIVRRWTRPAKPQRVRLGQRAGGGLGVLYLDRGWRLTLEDAAGAVLEEHQLHPGDALNSPPLWAGTSPLWRDGTDLVLGGARVARGAWEAYGGIEDAVLAWQPCAARPCPATVAGEDDGYRPHPWARELFGVDALALSGASTGTAAVATREQPNSSGWTLRQVPAAALRSGDVAALQQARAEVWRPPRGTSLEDPLLVRGAARAILVGTLYDEAAGGPTGQVWVAEAGGALRQIGQVGVTRANAEISAVELQGVLYIAAEADAQRSALWAYRDRGLVLLGTVPGNTPSLAAAEGALWLSSSAGLWRMVP